MTKKLSPDTTVYAEMALAGWGTSNIILPLKAAHELQALLATHAIGIGNAYRAQGPNTRYIKDYEVPDVKVYGVTGMPLFDCRGMSPAEVRDWEQSIADAEENAEIIDPQTFVLIRRQPDESNT